MWQDYIFSIGNIVLIVANIPALLGKQKPPISTSLMIGSILSIFGLAYASLGLWLSFVLVLINAATWFVLACQVSKRRHHSH